MTTTTAQPQPRLSHGPPPPAPTLLSCFMNCTVDAHSISSMRTRQRYCIGSRVEKKGEKNSDAKGTENVILQHHYFPWHGRVWEPMKFMGALKNELFFFAAALNHSFRRQTCRRRGCDHGPLSDESTGQWASRFPVAMGTPLNHLQCQHLRSPACMFGKESSITVSVLHICVSIKINCEEETGVDSWEIFRRMRFPSVTDAERTG